MRFGPEVRRIRKSLNMTLAQLAKKIGSHKGYVSGIESSKVNPPSMKFIPKIAKALGVDLEDLTLRAWVDKAPKLIRERVDQEIFGVEYGKGLK